MTGVTSDPNDPRLTHGPDTEPRDQAEVYLVLSVEERARGFVRPLRRAYRHVGPGGPRYDLLDLTADQAERYAGAGYVKFEAYPAIPDVADRGITGRYWTQEQLDKVDKGCGVETRMGLALCETYARQPSFYGATYCVGCGMHLPVAEFVWVEDGARVGS